MNNKKAKELRRVAKYYGQEDNKYLIRKLKKTYLSGNYGRNKNAQ